MAETNDVTYHVSVDFDTFKQIFLEQNRRYQRKIGILLALIGGAMCVLSVIGMDGVVTLESLGYTAIFALMLVFGIVMAVRPVALFKTRGAEVRGYFANHGAEVSASDPLEGLRCDFDVTVCELGFIETFADGTQARLPWFSLTGDVAACAFGHVFPGDDGKNSSMLYNMLGINAYLREGLVGEPLPVPATAESQRPGIVDEIAERIRVSRETYGKGGKHAASGQDAERLTAWLEG